MLSSGRILVSLHIDLEEQKNYRPGYPIEKRGIYYLARQLSSQLSLVTEETDYGQLEKCYGIWLCRDRVPKNEQYTISVYEMTNTKDTGIRKGKSAKKKPYDLMTMVLIRLGSEAYDGDEEDEDYELLRFLNVLMYPRKADFMDVMRNYIDFSENEELWREVKEVRGLGQCILEEGFIKGFEQGVEYRLIDMVRKKMNKGKSPEQIADELDEKLSHVEKICGAITAARPDDSSERVYALLHDKGS